MKLVIAVVVSALLSTACALSEPKRYLSREDYWPPMSSYSDMHLGALSTEITLIRDDFEYFKQRSDPKSKRLANEARNRLGLLFQLYSKRSGMSIENVLRNFGYSTGQLY